MTHPSKSKKNLSLKLSSPPSKTIRLSFLTLVLVSSLIVLLFSYTLPLFLNPHKDYLSENHQKKCSDLWFDLNQDIQTSLNFLLEIEDFLFWSWSSEQFHPLHSTKIKTLQLLFDIVQRQYITPLERSINKPEKKEISEQELQNQILLTIFHNLSLSLNSFKKKVLISVFAESCLLNYEDSPDSFLLLLSHSFTDLLALDHSLSSISLFQKRDPIFTF